MVAQWLEPWAGVRARTVVQAEREREGESLISMLMISKALLITFVSSGMTSADNTHFPKDSTVMERKEKKNIRILGLNVIQLKNRYCIS